MPQLTLGFSPCPNDTFIFHALVHNRLGIDLSVKEHLEDVETLNRLVLAGELDVSKISFHLLGHVRENYVLLRSGSALGRGCGPLIVARNDFDLAELPGKRIAIPGRYTTAALLLKLFNPSIADVHIMPFYSIMSAVASGEVDAGVIIHESRFTFASYGLHCLQDLGEWWEGETGHPIPLGGIVARRSLDSGLIRQVEMAIRRSVEYAFGHPDASSAYIRAHAQEMDEAVVQSHIGLYVNRFSMELGPEGEAAVADLLARAQVAGIIPVSDSPLFV
jgi:1,4-dihydroxy-6-naphthoate synthase